MNTADPPHHDNPAGPQNNQFFKDDGHLGSPDCRTGQTNLFLMLRQFENMQKITSIRRKYGLGARGFGCCRGAS